MKMLKRIAYILLGIFALIFAISFFLPNEWHVDESIVIKGDKEAIYAEIANLKAWQEWAAWNQKSDPTAVYTFEGPELGVGAHQFWEGKKVKKGNLLITKADPSYGIEYDLFFGDSTNANKGKIIFEENEEGVKLRWIDDGAVEGFPLVRYMVPYINKMVSEDFKKGLENLKLRIESPKAEQLEPKNEDAEKNEQNNEDQAADNDAQE